MEITLRPTLKQHQCYEALKNPDIDEVFFGGGAGGGKSWAICESRLINAIQYPGYKSFIGRNELKRLMQSTFVTWNKVCKQHNIPRSLWRLDGKYNYIEFVNPKTGQFDGQGSRIDLLDMKFLPSDDPLYERFGSLEYTDGAIEEAGEVHPLAYEVIRTRTNRHMNDELGVHASLLCTGNPKKNWTYTTFYKPWNRGVLPKDMVFIQSLYSDNPYTAQSYGKTLSKIKDKVTRERLMDGNWEYENDPSVLMDFEAISDLFTNTISDEDEYGYILPSAKYLTLDVARFGGDKIVATCWNGWRAYKIRYKTKQSLEDTKLWVLQIMQEEGIPRSHVMADEDGVGGGLIDMLPGIKGFIANSSALENETEYEYLSTEDEKERQKHGKKVYANLKTQCAYILAEKVNNREASIFCDDEEVKQWIIQDLENIKEKHVDDDDKKKRLIPKEDVKAVIGRSPDFGDTFIMRGYFDIKPPKKAHVVTQTRPDWISRRAGVSAINDMEHEQQTFTQTRPKFNNRRR